MLALRILTLPIAMTAFTVLYVIANKAPQAVESANIFIWLLLPVALVYRVISSVRERRKSKT